MERKENKKEKEIEQKIKKILEDVEKKTYTKKNLEKMEDFHKKISYISPEDLLKSFTI